MHENKAERGENLRLLMVQRQLRRNFWLLCADLKGQENFDRVIGILQAGCVKVRLGLAEAETSLDQGIIDF
jgi:hypothetical protein